MVGLVFGVVSIERFTNCEYARCSYTDIEQKCNMCMRGWVNEHHRLAKMPGKRRDMIGWVEHILK